MSEILDSVGRNKEHIVDIIQTISKEVAVARNAHVGISKRMASLVFGFLVVVLAALTTLVYTDKMSGDALTFVVGVMVGYLIQFVQGLQVGE